MATDKTPDHKRIARAEQGRDQWKIKAQLRREENEKLKRELESKTLHIYELVEESLASQNQLLELQKRFKEQEKLIDNLKKKLSN